MANEFKVKKGLIVDGTNTVLDIQGTSGQLFSVTDSLTGDLFSVSDVSGVPIFNVNSSGLSSFDGDVTFAGDVTISKNEPQLRLKRVDGLDDDWKFYSWASGLNIYPQTTSTIFFGRDGATTDVNVYNGDFTVASGDISAGGNLEFVGDALISSDTNDASDNSQIIITGGGAAGDTRGASVHLAGNENGNGGLLQLRAGDGSVGGIRLYEGGSERMRIYAGKVFMSNTGSTGTAASLLHLKGTGDAIRVESTNTGVGGAQIDLMHYTTSPADEDVHGFINFGGYYSGTSATTGAQILSKWTDVSERHARLEFKTADTTVGTALTLAHDKSATFAGDVFTPGLYVNATSAVIGTQTAIVSSGGSENLMRWGSSTDGNSQHSYRFRVDQNFEFIGNSGSADTINLKSSDGTASFGGNVFVNQGANLTSQALQVNGFIDITNVSGTALRWYNGSTFRGGLGLDNWAHSGSAADTTMYVSGDNSFFVSTNNVKRLEIDSSGLEVFNDLSFGSTGANGAGRLIIKNDTSGNQGTAGIGVLKQRDVNRQSIAGQSTHIGGYIWYTIKIPSGYSNSGLGSDIELVIRTGGKHHNGKTLKKYIISTGNGTTASIGNLNGVNILQTLDSRIAGSYGGGATEVEFYYRTSVANDTGEVIFRLYRADREPVTVVEINPQGAWNETDSKTPSLVCHGLGTTFDSGTGKGQINQTRPTSNLSTALVVQKSGFEQTTGTNGKFSVSANGPASGYSHEIARFVNMGSLANSSYMYIGAYSGTDWRLGKNVFGTSGITDFHIAKHSGSTASISINNTGNGYVGIGVNSASYPLDVNGTIRATGDVIAYSDERVKENIKTIDNSLEKVSKLRGVEFNKIGDDVKSIGVIAQEIEKILPEVVKEDDKGMKSVAYGNISGLLIEAIKELKNEIEQLKKQINNG